MSNLEEIQQLISSLENDLRKLKELLFNEELQRKTKDLKIENTSGKVIEGIFNGEAMIDQKGKKYPIPVNYASKSKLVVGDGLKLTIKEDGSFVFKQIAPVERKKVIGKVNQDETGDYSVYAEGKNYHVLSASITYFQAKPGDNLTILIPKNHPSHWAAVENVIEKV